MYEFWLVQIGKQVREHLFSIGDITHFLHLHQVLDLLVLNLQLFYEHFCHLFNAWVDKVLGILADHLMEVGFILTVHLISEDLADDAKDSTTLVPLELLKNNLSFHVLVLDSLFCR